MPTNTPGEDRGSDFPPLAGLASIHKIFSPNSRIDVLSLLPCSLRFGVFPSLPMSYLFMKNQSQVTESTGEVGSPQCAGKGNQEVSGVVHCVRLCVICQHSSSGTCRIQILTTAQTFPPRISHYPTVLVAYRAVTNSKDTTIKLHSTGCCEPTSLTMQKAASTMSTQFPVTTPEFCLPYHNQLHN